MGGRVAKRALNGESHRAQVLQSAHRKPLIHAHRTGIATECCIAADITFFHLRGCVCVCECVFTELALSSEGNPMENLHRMFSKCGVACVSSEVEQRYCVCVCVCVKEPSGPLATSGSLHYELY